MKESSIKIKKGRFEIILRENCDLDIYAFGELWQHNPQMFSLWTDIIDEMTDLRKIVCDVQYDFDPEKQLGPYCGPDMLKTIKKYEETYGKLDPTMY